MGKNKAIQGKKILLGVSGGIAVFKAVSLCSKLVQLGAEVRVIMTESATKFVTPLTFQTISRHEVATDTFLERDPSVVSHIDLADWADLVVLAPATANLLGKMAGGLADDMLTTALLATQAPVLAAPAMNVHMYDHPAVVHNLHVLRQRGIQLIEPNSGQLACGYVGKGRLPEPEEIIERIDAWFSASRQWSGRKVLISAGGTVERIDPVRYITNDSSGKMGYALAEAAAVMGAEVILVSANVKLAVPAGVNMIPVISAQDMYNAVLDKLPQVDIVIKAAAVADYRPVHIAANKIKKKEDRLVLELERTEDILAEVGRRKTGQYVVGFAAETDNLQVYAMDKLTRKNCDLVVANDVSVEGIGFGADNNAVKVFDANGLALNIECDSKASIAAKLLEFIHGRLVERESL
jgi:phosphopantothenoylcysteine decarboxylase/phosphopantothenate--cysteine ligase